MIKRIVVGDAAKLAVGVKVRPFFGFLLHTKIFFVIVLSLYLH